MAEVRAAPILAGVLSLVDEHVNDASDDFRAEHDAEKRNTYGHYNGKSRDEVVSDRLQHSGIYSDICYGSHKSSKHASFSFHKFVFYSQHAHA